MDRISEFTFEQSDASDMFPYRCAESAASFVALPCSKSTADGGCAAPDATGAGRTPDPTDAGPATGEKPRLALAPAECGVPTLTVGRSGILHRCTPAAAIEPTRNSARWFDADETLDEDFDELDQIVHDTELFETGGRVRAVYID